MNQRSFVKQTKKIFSKFVGSVSCTPECKVWNGSKKKVKNIKKYRETLKEYTSTSTAELVILFRHDGYESNALLNDGVDVAITYCDDVYEQSGFKFDIEKIYEWFKHVHMKETAGLYKPLFDFMAEPENAPLFKTMKPEVKKTLEKHKRYADIYGKAPILLCPESEIGRPRHFQCWANGDTNWNYGNDTTTPEQQARLKSLMEVGEDGMSFISDESLKLIREMN